MRRSDRHVPDICPVPSATVGQVVTWPMPLTEKPFPLYKLTVEDIDVPVWSGRVREDIHQPADAGFTHMYNGPTEWCGFARFDFAGSVAVAVDRDFDSAEIVPRSAGVVCAVDGRTVRNCFMRTHDDTYAVKTTVPERPSEHIRYERCVAWNDWGFALGVTYETRADIRDVAFTDCDVIFARWWPIGVHATDGGAIEDIRFERIGVDCPQSAIAPHMGRALARIDNQKDCWSTEPGIARVRNILLRDIDVSGQAFDRIDIHGNDAEHPITDVRFENVRINGEPLDAGKVAVNEHVHDWVVRPDNFDIPRTSDYVVSVGGQPAAVYAMPTRYGQTLENNKPVSVYDEAPLRQPMYFACVDIGGPTTVTIEIGFLTADVIRSATAHPLSRGIEVRHEGARVTFEVDRPGTVTLLVNGDHRDRPLHLFFSPPVEAPPEGAIVFGPGYHDLGYDNPITLTDGQTLHLAPGAWVEGIVRATDARNIRIMGRGVLSQRRPDKQDYAGGVTAPNGIVLSNCQDVLIEGIVETRGIVYDDIRVEHCEEHLFFFRYYESIWAIPGDLTFPGTVADITIRNVSVLHAATGPRSEISGYAPDKRFENITIENLRYGGKPVTDAAGMGLRLNEHVSDVRFANNSNIRRN